MLLKTFPAKNCKDLFDAEKTKIINFNEFSGLRKKWEFRFRKTQKSD